jgi:hypothetical protein
VFSREPVELKIEKIASGSIPPLEYRPNSIVFALQPVSQIDFRLGWERRKAQSVNALLPG